MVAPFDGFVIPDLLPLAVLLVGTGLIAVLLYALRPPVTEQVVLAFIPWMVSGAILHVFWQLGERFDDQLYPPAIADLFAAPAVYLTTFIAAGMIWVLSAIIVPNYDKTDQIASYIAAMGIGTMTPLIGLAIWQGLGDELVLQPIWPTLGLILSLVVTFIVYMLIGTWRTYVIAEARWIGAFVIFAHVFDAITTTIGVDILGAGERSVLPELIMDFAADLPTAEFIGTGWLFVLVKIVLASAIVVLFADYVKERPAEGNLLLAFIALVGFGPAVHNFFLFLLIP